MKPERRQKILTFNAERAKDRQAAEDLITLLSLIPNGQRKQLAKKEKVQEIFERYGITVQP